MSNDEIFYWGGSPAESLCIQGQLSMDFQGPEMLTYSKYILQRHRGVPLL